MKPTSKTKVTVLINRAITLEQLKKRQFEAAAASGSPDE